MSEVLRIGRDVFERLLSEARLNPSIECCGLLAGRDALISAVFPARNALQSAKGYEIAPEELFSIFRRMRAEALEHLGIYHSHPQGENFPSPLDIDEAFYPEAAYLILSPLPSATRPVRAFRIREGQAREIDLQMI